MSASAEIRNNGSGKTDWETPQWLFNWLDSMFDFDLDAAADKDNACIANYISEQENALEVWWGTRGKRAFINPPYGKMDQWIVKMADEALHGVVVVAVLPANTCTSWFRAVHESAAIWFIQPRVNYADNGVIVQGNSNSTMIAVFGGENLPDLTKFHFESNTKLPIKQGEFGVIDAREAGTEINRFYIARHMLQKNYK